MSSSRRECTSVNTSAASLTLATGACSFVGLTVWASVAGTITIADGSDIIVGPVALAATQTLNVFPALARACTSGLSATNSGGCVYTVFYGA